MKLFFGEHGFKFFMDEEPPPPKKKAKVICVRCRKEVVDGKCKCEDK